MIEETPQSEVPGQVVAAVPVEKPKESVPELDLGNGKKFSWKVEETCKV